MKHNELIKKLLMEFPGDSLVFFRTPESKISTSLGHNFYEVDNTLVFFKSLYEDEIATISDLLERIGDNYYTNDDDCEEQAQVDFQVALCNLHDWDDDDSGFSNMLSVIDVVQIENKVILITKPFDEDLVDERMENLKIISNDPDKLHKFIEKTKELRNSPEFTNNINIV